MEVKVKRKLKDGKEYDHLFPKAEGTAMLVKKGNASLDDTMRLIPEKIRENIWQTEKIAGVLKGRNEEETCYNIWKFCYDHIEFIRDPRGKEMVQSPRYTWQRRAGDCEDMTSLIASICFNLGLLPLYLRIAEYDPASGFQHIYPIVQLKNGKRMVIDCVLENFNEEHPYIRKKDLKMDLYYLNGIDNRSTNIDAQDLLSDDLGELGLKLRFGQGIKKAGSQIKTGVKNTTTKVGSAIKKGIHAVNKVNPVTALLRAGLLAGMKLNIMNVAGRLKYVFLSDDQARAKKFDMVKFNRLKSVWANLSKIFHGAGGDIPNLKRAILEGKGNSTKEVPLSGLGYVDNVMYSENMPITRIIGEDIYRAEMQNVEGLSGTLGVVETGAAIAAATTALTAIATLLKSIGSLRAGAGDAEPSSPETTLPGMDNNADTGAGMDALTSQTSIDTSNVAAGDGNATSIANGQDTSAGEESGYSDGGTDGGGTSSASTTSEVTRTSQTNTNAREASTGGGIIEWAKKNPLPAAGIAVAGLAVLVGGTWFIVKQVKRSKKEKSGNGMSGVPQKRRRNKGNAQKSRNSGGVRFMQLK